jgi:hypothetical protein
VTEPAGDGSVPAPRPWLPAGLAGAAAFLWVAGMAAAIGIFEWFAAGRPFGVRLTWKLAGLYVGVFHGAGVEVRAGLPSSAGGTDEPVNLSGLSTVHVTFLLGTILAGAVVWRAGRGMGLRAGGGRRRRIVWGAAVAPSYAVLVLLVALVVRLSFPDAGFTDVRVVAWQAFLGAVLLAGLVGAAGGAATLELRAGRFEAWLRGGWRMTVALVVLSFAGFLVVAGVRADASGAFVGWLSRAGAPGAVGALHHVLFLPNQSLLIAAPAMGSCLRLDGSGSQPTTLCLRTLTVRPGLGGLVLPQASSESVVLPLVWLLFLSVPALATVWGGSASVSGAGSAREAAIRGAGAGLVFAAAVVAAEFLSAIWIRTESGGTILWFGADLARTGALACAWGIGGGVVGAVLAWRRQEPAGPAGDPPPDAPPSPTSV